MGGILAKGYQCSFCCVSEEMDERGEWVLKL